MMKHILFFLLLFPAFLLAEESAFLWKVTHPERPGVLFLAGSIHVGQPEMFPLDSVYDAALEQADYVVFEIAEPSPAKILSFTIRNGVYRKNSGSLKEALGKEDFSKFAKEMRKLVPALTSMRLSLLKPWAVFSMFSSLVVQKLGFNPEYGFERVFLRAADARPKRSLETEERQLSVLSNEKVEPDILKCLRDCIADPAKTEKELLELVDAMKSSDGGVLLRQQKEMKEEAPALYQSLMIDRNRDMTGKLLDMMTAKGTGFVLIGLAHFIGDDNMRTMFEKYGCKVVTLKKTGVPGKLSPDGMEKTKKLPVPAAGIKE